jgi:hypothetical protein
MNTFRPAIPRDRPGLRGLIGLLLAACICVALIASQSFYGDTAELIIARWAPQLVLTSSLPLPAQPSPSVVQVAATEPIPPSTQTAPQDVTPTAAPASAALAQLLQAIMRDLANVEQGIEQLKASQEQIASDNAKAVRLVLISRALGYLRARGKQSMRNLAIVALGAALDVCASSSAEIAPA